MPGVSGVYSSGASLVSLGWFLWGLGFVGSIERPRSAAPPSQANWFSLLERVGFQIEQHKMTISRRALVAFDLTMPLAIPSPTIRLLLGSRGPRPPGFLLNFFERRLVKCVDDDEDDGCNLFVVARKP